jgi:hypothetical protein
MACDGVSEVNYTNYLSDTSLTHEFLKELRRSASFVSRFAYIKDAELD